MITGDPDAAAAVVDWRCRTFALYDQVRELSGTDVRAAHDLWRTQRDALFRDHPASALSQAKKERFTGLPIAAYDPGYRFECALDGHGAGEGMTVETGTDGAVSFTRLGTVALPGLGRLAVWQLRGYGGGLFVPFRDATAAKPDGSYGGGRYLLDTIKGAYLGRRGERFILDFNFAYNPSCAYDEAWACPLPGPGNRLAASIPVGELYAPHLAA
ncbi:DUF1684 domain-containing protein [Specibacter cremeus]|uniref:DUF1684 domain-containing protein n=1 Tax=Specibacter cremeus TaxID=1629051 RepID=UPI001F0C054A|nr:DUF1684 domain-containing protein [Specibacter cremeus]